MSAKKIYITVLKLHNYDSQMLSILFDLVSEIKMYL